jgi:hypothetical protein
MASCRLTTQSVALREFGCQHLVCLFRAYTLPFQGFGIGLEWRYFAGQLGRILLVGIAQVQVLNLVWCEL